ncbi:MAG TPA: pilus assembly protein, partial [Burkholderiales bacterium]|nr:pilus assembly protein [Burkholderiales bacterium]
EKFDTTMQALQGLPLGARPDLWESYGDARAKVLQVARPVSSLKARFPARTAEIDAAVAKSALTEDKVAYVPMVGRKTFWTALVDATSATILAYLPIDSF